MLRVCCEIDVKVIEVREHARTNCEQKRTVPRQGLADPLSSYDTSVGGALRGRDVTRLSFRSRRKGFGAIKME